MASVERPISPHLQIYKPQISSTLSILHRATGIALGVGMLLLTWWLVGAASGAEPFAVVNGFIRSWLGRLIMFGFTFAFFYHLLNGIRHLGWDLLMGLDVPTMTKTGWAVVYGSIGLTILCWIAVFAL